MKYKKPPLTIEDQVNLLASRGMTIPDHSRACRYLSHINYFRLRGYWIPFEEKNGGSEHRFRENTTFDDVLNLYIFDRKFRLLVLEAIERIEVSLRSHFANEMGVTYGSHFYLDPKYAKNTKIYQNLIDSLKNEINRSTELFIMHYRKTYDDPRLPPVWAAAEVMSFGQLSLWFKNLKIRKDRNCIAKVFGLDEKVMQSFMHHLTFIRNVTAHHGRLWNRRITITMKLPKHPRELAGMFSTGSDRKIGNTIIMLGYLLKLISPGTSWLLRMRKLIEQSAGIHPAAMGFKEDWKDLPFWKIKEKR